MPRPPYVRGSSQGREMASPAPDAEKRRTAAALAPRSATAGRETHARNLSYAGELTGSGRTVTRLYSQQQPRQQSPSMTGNPPPPLLQRQLSVQQSQSMQKLVVNPQQQQGGPTLLPQQVQRPQQPTPQKLLGPIQPRSPVRMLSMVAPPPHSPERNCMSMVAPPMHTGIDTMRSGSSSANSKMYQELMASLRHQNGAALASMPRTPSEVPTRMGASLRMGVENTHGISPAQSFQVPAGGIDYGGYEFLMARVRRDFSEAASEGATEVEAVEEDLQQQPFPKSGKVMVVKLMCLHLNQSHPVRIHHIDGHPVTSDWTIDHLLKATEIVTGVHRASQRLFHAGKEMVKGTTIRECIGLPEKDLPDWCTVHMLVDDDSFPRRLVSFGLRKVPLSAEDFILPAVPAKFGFHWIMLNEVVERFGVRSTGDNQVTAQCSPPMRLTISEEERSSAGIPDTAWSFVWSYPVAHWDQVDQDPHLLEDWGNGGSVPPSTAVKDFLAVGGFMFFDINYELVHVAACLCNKGCVGGVQFHTPRKWERSWTKAILEDGRFHPVTIAALRDAGAQYFCWLLPGETFTDDDGQKQGVQPAVPYGGFAFLFHELTATSAEELSVDCYFPVTSISGSGACESFALLGEEKQSELLGHTSAQLNFHSICAEGEPEPSDEAGLVAKKAALSLSTPKTSPRSPTKAPAAAQH